MNKWVIKLPPLENKRGVQMLQTKNIKCKQCQVIPEDNTEHWSGAWFNQVHSYLTHNLDKEENIDGLN